MTFETKELMSWAARDMRRIQNFDKKDYNKLSLFGSDFKESDANRIMIAQDSVQGGITTPSISTPIQFIQEFAPGHVNVITAARKVDKLTGLSMLGTWFQEEIIQGLLEYAGAVQPYGDYSNVPLSSWNYNFNKRTIVRFMIGMEVKRLELERAAAMNIDSGAEKRNAATLQLEIVRNLVGMYGYNNGLNQTYGFLNEPGLPPYITVPNGASGFPEWSTKTYNELITDILNGVAAIQQSSQDNIDPQETPMTMALATSVYQYLFQVPQYGNSVMEWIRGTYPSMRVESAPELDGANGGANVGFIYAESVQDGSTDDERVWMQCVPTKFMVIGVKQEMNGYSELYSNATAGQMLKRPFAVYAMSGL